MKKVLLGILGAVVVLGVVAAMLFKFGPRDLGIQASEQDIQAVKAKTGVTFETIASGTTPQDSLKYSGSRSISGTYTSTDITALLTMCTWIYCPVTDGQVRINADGSVEASGILRTDRLAGFFQAMGSSEPEVQTALEKLHVANLNPSIYMKGRPVIENGRVQLNIESAEVAHVPVPADWIKAYGGETTALVERQMRRVPGMNLKSVNFVNGEMKVDGTYPQVEATQK